MKSLSELRRKLGDNWNQNKRKRTAKKIVKLSFVKHFSYFSRLIWRRASKIEVKNFKFSSEPVSVRHQVIRWKCWKLKPPSNLPAKLQSNRSLKEIQQNSVLPKPLASNPSDNAVITDGIIQPMR